MAIDKGFQSLTMPNEAPQAAAPLRDNPNATFRQSHLANNVLKLAGQTDAVNGILLNSQAQDTDREGNFDLAFPIGDENFVELRVITPLGTEKRYNLPVR